MYRNLSLKLVMSVGPLLAFVTGQVANANAQPEVREGGNLPDSEKNTARTASVQNSICEPFLANTKTVGIPIQVQDEYGQILNDLSGLTFELTDGTNIQDVTTYVGDADDQRLAISLKSVYQSYFGNSSSFSVTAPDISFAIPSYFFLACSPNLNNGSIVFGQDVVLQVKSGSKIISSGSLEGRAPVRHLWDVLVDGVYQGPVANELVPATFLTPNRTLDLIYNDFLNEVDRPLDENFASILVAIFQMYGTNNVNNNCLNLFWDQSGFSTRAIRLIDELGNGSSSLNRVEMLAFLNGTDQSENCAIPLPSNSWTRDRTPDYLINLVTAQILLDNGPRGDIPESRAGRHHALAPATILRPENPLPLPTTPPSPTTTVVQLDTTVAPTTTVQSVATATRLPKTGTSFDGTWLAAVLVALGFGFVGVRRSRSSLD